MLGLSAVPAVIQFFGFLFLPESPRWLIQKGQTQKARRILSRMRGNQTIDEEYDSIKNNIEEEEKEVGSGRTEFLGLCLLAESPHPSNFLMLVQLYQWGVYCVMWWKGNQ